MWIAKIAVIAKIAKILKSNGLIFVALFLSNNFGVRIGALKFS